MRYVAKLLTALAVIAALAVGYLLYFSDARLTVNAHQVVAAADAGERFNEALAAMDSAREDVVVFSAAPVAGAENYVFITYSVTVENRDVLPMEWFGLTVTPKAGDVALYKTEIPDVPAYESATFTFTLLTSRGSIDYAREITLDYFFYGHEKSLSLTVGAA